MVGHIILYRVGLAILEKSAPILVSSTSQEELKERLSMVGSYFTDHNPLMQVRFDEDCLLNAFLTTRSSPFGTS